MLPQRFSEPVLCSADLAQAWVCAAGPVVRCWLGRACSLLAQACVCAAGLVMRARCRLRRACSLPLLRSRWAFAYFFVGSIIPLSCSKKVIRFWELWGLGRSTPGGTEPSNGPKGGPWEIRWEMKLTPALGHFAKDFRSWLYVSCKGWRGWVVEACIITGWSR